MCLESVLTHVESEGLCLWLPPRPASVPLSSWCCHLSDCCEHCRWAVGTARLPVPPAAAALLPTGPGADAAANPAHWTHCNCGVSPSTRSARRYPTYGRSPSPSRHYHVQTSLMRMTIIMHGQPRNAIGKILSCGHPS